VSHTISQLSIVDFYCNYTQEQWSDRSHNGTLFAERSRWYLTRATAIRLRRTVASHGNGRKEKSLPSFSLVDQKVYSVYNKMSDSSFLWIALTAPRSTTAFSIIPPRYPPSLRIPPRPPFETNGAGCKRSKIMIIIVAQCRRRQWLHSLWAVIFLYDINDKIVFLYYTLYYTRRNFKIQNLG